MAAFEQVIRIKQELEQVQVDLEKAEREYNYEAMARLRYGTIKDLEQRIQALEAKLSNLQGARTYPSEDMDMI